MAGAGAAVTAGHGAVSLVDRAGEVDVRVDGDVARDSVFRISSMTKPVVALAALRLVESGALDLDGSVDRLLPELADRGITTRDVLTFRIGLGMDLTAPFPQPQVEQMEELQVNTGPPRPQLPPEPDEFMRRLATVPPIDRPGGRWLYNTAADVLGVLVGRAVSAPLDAALRDLVFEPLGMGYTGFWADSTRLTPAYAGDELWDPPEGQWSSPPRFPSGAGGLVSTIDDYHAFACELLRSAPAGMTAMHVRIDLGGFDGWGFGVGVRDDGSYGWDGGLGSAWRNHPARGQIGIILTTGLFAQHWPPPPVIEQFLRQLSDE